MKPVASINSIFISEGRIYPRRLSGWVDAHCSLLLLSAAFHCALRGQRAGDSHREKKINKCLFFKKKQNADTEEY